MAGRHVGGYGRAAAFVFPTAFGAKADVDSWEFWFAMQIAMICGFVTSYPTNWYLISAGIKERM